MGFQLFIIGKTAKCWALHEISNNDQSLRNFLKWKFSIEKYNKTNTCNWEYDWQFFNPSPNTTWFSVDATEIFVQKVYLRIEKI